jgi:hypothetical protein
MVATKSTILTPTARRIIHEVFRQNMRKSERQPDDPCEDSQKSDDWYKVSCEKVRNALNGSSLCCAFSNDLDDLIKPKW